MVKRLLLLVGLSLAGAGWAQDDYAALIAANPSVEEAACSYVRTSTDEDGVRVEAYDDGWRLVSLDGETPDKRALEAYAEADEQRAERNHPAEMDLEALIKPGSLVREEANGTSIRFSFEMVPDDEEDEAFLPHMDASLWTDANYRVQRFRMNNREPVSPQTGVKIEQFDQDMRFRWHEALGATVLEQVHIKLQGRAFIFKKLEQDARVDFSDIRCAVGL